MVYILAGIGFIFLILMAIAMNPPKNPYWNERFNGYG